LSGQVAARTGVYTVGSSSRGKSSDRQLIPIENTLYLPDTEDTLLGVFQSAGYTSIQIGKWHVGKDPLKQGVTINIAGSEAGHPKSYYSPYRMKNLEEKDPGEYLTDRLTDEAIGLIETHKEDPFFLYLPYYTVHTPLQGRGDLVAKYKGIEGVNANYAAMVEALDENIGRLLISLEEFGLTTNTMVLFTSDNGGVHKHFSQRPWRAGKGSYYEGGIREPLVVYWPGVIAAGSVSDTPVIGLDFFPTFLAAAGVKRPDDKILDGVDLMPILSGSGEIKDRALYWYFPIYLQGYKKHDLETRDPIFRTRPGSAIRYQEWKLIEYFEDGAVELFDLSKDKGERENLAEKMPLKVNELKAMLENWRQETGAKIPTVKNPDYQQKGS